MAYTLLPTPSLQKIDESAMVTAGPASPLTFAAEVDQASRDTLAAWIALGNGAVPVALVYDKSLGREACRLRIAASGIELAASCGTGWRHGIGRLRQLGPCARMGSGEIDDSPALAMRGFHLNFSIQSLGFEEGKRLLEAMAHWRLNTVLMEYNQRYHMPAHPEFAAPNALSRVQIAALVEYACGLGIEPIPLQQCLGHVNYILQHDAFADLREEQKHRDQFCPLHPGSLALFRELVDDMLELHPGARYFHIGGDEARRLGSCPLCAEVAARHGKGRLYVDYVTQAVEYVRGRGLTPIIWDDMLCAHPDVIGQMPREAVIMYWDYWTTRDPSALFVARPDGGRGVVVDAGWRDLWRAELGETERRTVDFFTNALDLRREMSPAFMQRFGRYLGPQFPKRIRAFPYLEYYRDLGFRVIGAPTGAGNTSNWRQMPDFPRYGANIHAFSRRLREAGAMGIVTSAWYSMPFEALLPGLMFTGQFAWNPDVPDAN